ncbi:hypothetical protein LVB77_14750 [Lysobacter sp. 5GHs7-4]|uniref:hypothetical protein n=1 Tax=Lysobacter sp. 5GHs7-4 TaxID=2904253 RepID=UPI001E57EE1E|nr:hypothetical protein [Lysobacter sp. 5GHs7-4]UHQ21925.1 hypothetical protein LVB77_14750 [Lysobacter sp. 5GHs7-4]
MTERVDVLAVFDRDAEAAHHYRVSIKSSHLGDAQVVADHNKGLSIAARAAVAELIAELEKAHQIILVALNALPPGAKRKFEQKVIAAGLDGEGTTRFHERRAALARCGVTS